MRLLRSYESVAQEEHWCDDCCTYIMPGDFYGGRVMLRPERKEERIMVFKHHIYPACPFDPNEEFREHDEQDANLESQLFGAGELPLAA